ncbi:MAG: hypothetical protein LUG52_07845 [Clostridia bacterium]|nr:hypothetical protein [Clostridia bacterium]
MRQEQSRRKTPAARILSLALALCMIAAFVPAMTLTAGAESTSVTSDGMLPDTAVAVFDGGLGGADTNADAISGDTAVSTAWTDWTSSWSGISAEGQNNINIVNSSDGYYWNSSVSMLALQFYDVANATANVKTTAGYGADSDWFAYDYISTVGTSVVDDIAIIGYNPTTGDEVIIDQFRTSASGFYPSASASYTTDGELSDDSTTSTGYVDWGNYRIFVEKGDGTYTVSYYYAANHSRNISYTSLGSKTYSGSLDGYGFGGLYFTRVTGGTYWYTNSRMWEPMVYADTTTDGYLSVGIQGTTSQTQGGSIWDNTLDLAAVSSYLARESGTTFSGSYGTLGSDRYGTVTFDVPAAYNIKSATLRMHVYRSHGYLIYSAWEKIGIYNGAVTPSSSNSSYLLTDAKIYGGGTSTSDSGSDYVNKIVYADVTDYITAGESNTLTLAVPIAALGIDDTYSVPMLIVEYEEDTSITYNDVTVNYTLDGTTVDDLTVTKTVASGYNASFDAMDYFVSSGYYYADAVTYESVTADATYTIELTEVPVYTWQAGSYNTGNLDDAGTYPAKRNFAAFNWGGEGTYDRVGVAILDADAGYNTYTLNVTNARSYGSYTAYIYAVSYADYSAIDLTSTTEMTDLLATNTPVATITSSTGASVTEIDLGDVSSLIDESGKIVILGTSISGLYGIEGSTMSVTAANMYDVTYVNEDGDTLGTLTVEADASVAAKTFYNENDGTIYTADAVDAVTGDTEVTATALDVIAPTYDGFLTPNTTDTSDVESYITADNDGMIRVTGSSTDAFGVVSMFDEYYIGSGAEASKTRVGYLEFDVPTGYVAGDDIVLTLSVATIDSDAVGSYVGAIATTLDVDSLTDGEGNGSSIDLGIDSTDTVYYSEAALTADTDTVTIDLTGIEADNGAVKVIIVVPRGEVRFANEERTTFGGAYEGQTAYVEVTASEPVDAVVTFTCGGEEIGSTYSVAVSKDTTSVTVPAGIYNKQYYLDSDTSVSLDDSYAATLEISELSLFSWRNDAIVYSSNGEANTYNIAVDSDTWADDRVAYAYASIPEVTENTQILEVTVKAYYNNGTWQAPGTITLNYSTDYDKVKALDLAGGTETTTALSKLTFDDTLAVLDVDLTDFDSTTNIATFSVKFPTEISGNVVLEIVAGGNSNGSIVSVSSITFDVVDKDLGVELVDGAQIRVGKGFDDVESSETYQDLLGDSGLRFIATFTTDNTMAGVDGAVYGIAIFDGGFDEEEFDVETASIGEDNATLDGNAAVAMIQADKTQGDASVFTAAITNIQTSNYNRIYVAVPYVTVGEETYYDWDEAVARTPYQVAKGLLFSSDEDNTDGYTYTADEQTLIDVLNVYTNKTGARITLTQDGSGGYTVGYAEYANGATEFFEISTSTGDDGSFVITLTPQEDATFYNYAVDCFRANNASASAFTNKVEGATVALDEDNKTLVITIPASTTSGDGDNE